MIWVSPYTTERRSPFTPIRRLARVGSWARTPCYRQCSRLSSRASLPAVDTAGLTALWVGAWGDCRPVSYKLRSCLLDRWVRFHSLPGSKRYAGSEEEYAELIRRHLVVLAELLSHEGADQARELVVVTASWSDAPRPAPRAAEVAGALPAAAYWTSVLTDDASRPRKPGRTCGRPPPACTARNCPGSCAWSPTTRLVASSRRPRWAGFTTPMTAAPTLSPRAQATGTSSAARTRTGCPPTARDCDTPRYRTARWATSRPGRKRASPNRPSLTAEPSATRRAPEPPLWSAAHSVAGRRRSCTEWLICAID
jgi:hypothetical protein